MFPSGDIRASFGARRPPADSMKSPPAVVPLHHDAGPVAQKPAAKRSRKAAASKTSGQPAAELCTNDVEHIASSSEATAAGLASSGTATPISAVDEFISDSPVEAPLANGGSPGAGGKKATSLDMAGVSAELAESAVRMGAESAGAAPAPRSAFPVSEFDDSLSQLEDLLTKQGVQAKTEEKDAEAKSLHGSEESELMTIMDDGLDLRSKWGASVFEGF